MYHTQPQTTLRKGLINLLIMVVCIILDKKEYHMKALATIKQKVNHLSNHCLFELHANVSELRVICTAYADDLRYHQGTMGSADLILTFV